MDHYKANKVRDYKNDMEYTIEFIYLNRHYFCLS